MGQKAVRNTRLPNILKFTRQIAINFKHEISLKSVVQIIGRITRTDAIPYYTFLLQAS
jgi:hypothetical protein